MDESLISETLEALSSSDTARKAARNLNTLKGIRGTPQAEIARVGAAVWRDQKPSLAAEDALTRLFRSAWEDGMLAVGLLAALVPDGPTEALDIGLDWLARLDDNLTADALGWLVLGPAFAATGAEPERLRELALAHKGSHPAVRRALVSMGLAFLPLPLEGCAVAPLRARHGDDAIAFVEAPLSPLVGALAHAFLRDESPNVRKALRRVLKGWVKTDPAAVVAWEAEVRGGLPKLLSEVTHKARNKVKA
ncbi:MAG: DNA alkylation repair protein [Myxococcales bacterium]|nr:DNA alkylation repair protein [Myxococcales bacterium]